MPRSRVPHPITGNPVAIMDPSVTDMERLTEDLRKARAAARQAEEAYQEFVRAREALEGVFREQIDTFTAAQDAEAVAEKTLKEYLCNTYNMFGHLFDGKVYRFIPGLSVRERVSLKVTNHEQGMEWALKDYHNHQFLMLDEKKLAAEFTKEVSGRTLPEFLDLRKTLSAVVASSV